MSKENKNSMWVRFYLCTDLKDCEVAVREISEVLLQDL